MLNSQIIGYESLVDGLYKLSLASNDIPSSLVVKILRLKDPRLGKSFMLWHKCLGHIFMEIVEWKTNILPSLNFYDLKFGSLRDNSCDGFFTPTISSNKIFITFIDEFSRYDYLFLIKEQSKVLENFKIFLIGVEKIVGENDKDYKV
ncbi:hypothetical protein CR513_52261, partial [Mucuna pruriens]